MPPTYYRGCWHVVSRGLFAGYRHYLPRQKGFTTREPSSLTRSCCLKLSLIGQNSRLLPPVGVWAVLSPSLADHPLRPATDRRLGEPLPHQLANRTQAPPEADCSFGRRIESPTTCGISHPFGQLFPTSGQVTYALLSRPPLGSYQASSVAPRSTCMSHAPRQRLS